MSDNEANEPQTEEPADAEAPAEDTSVSAEGQAEQSETVENQQEKPKEEAVASDKAKPGLPVYRAPTVDENRSPEDVDKCLDHFLEVVGEKLLFREEQKLVKVNSAYMSDSYYGLFSGSANDYFRLLVSYKRRKRLLERDKAS